MPSQLCCRNCREWYDKEIGYCPHCEAERPAFNKSWYKRKMDNHMLAQAEASTPKAQHQVYYKELKRDLDRLVREY